MKKCVLIKEYSEGYRTKSLIGQEGIATSIKPQKEEKSEINNINHKWLQNQASM